MLQGVNFALKRHQQKFQPKIQSGTPVGNSKTVSGTVRKNVLSEQHS
jgi:hypothetical protein